MSNSDVLVIGGGIAGMLLAVRLRHRGASVTLAERGRLGQAASALNAGGVRQQFFQPENVRAAQASVAFLTGFEAEHGIPVGFTQRGYLYLCQTPEQDRRLAEGLTAQHALGVPSRRVSASDVTALAPGVSTDDVLAGYYCPTDGRIDPKVLMAALAQVTRRSGVTVLENTEIVSLTVKGGRIQEAASTAGPLAAGAMVNAAGPWAPSVAAMAGASLPITARRSQVFMISDAPALDPDLPHTFDMSGGYYVRPAGRGAWSGASFKPVLPAPVPAGLDAQWLEAGELHRRLSRRVPALAATPFDTAWAGIIEVTPDDNPVIGWTGPENLYTMAGFSGHGMCVAPGLAGPAAAEILDEDRGAELGLYRPGRFTDPGFALRREGMWLTERPAELADWGAGAAS
ncbi:MAG TPA: FAD-dependent oxidoreductase [Streptosporangiaceae bacterium]